MLMPAVSSVITFLRDVLECCAEMLERFEGIVGDRARPVGLHQAGRVGIWHVQVEAVNRHGLHGIQLPAQLIQPQDVGQDVDVAIRTRQRVDAFSLVQRLPGLEMPH